MLMNLENTATMLVKEYNAKLPDLKDFGFSDYKGRKVLSESSVRTLGVGDVVEVPRLQAIDDLVTFQAVGETAPRFLGHGVYLRDESLRGQMRLSSAYFGYSENGEIKEV